MIWTASDERRVELHLRELLARGRSIEDAIYSLHHDQGVGVLLLWGPVATITGQPKEQAQRLVLRALARAGQEDRA